MQIAVIIILGIALLASLALNGFILLVLTKNHQEEKKDLHNRLMSREYPEYLQGEHTRNLLNAESEEIRNKPKAEERLSKEFLEMKKMAERF